MEGRPDFKTIKTGKSFNSWYWLKYELIEICKYHNLPSTGRKFELRDRIMYALDNKGAILPLERLASKTSTFDWSNAMLTPDTLITDNISFGQNLRKFMQSQIQAKFTFNTAFMEWARKSSGKTLKEAVDKWLEIKQQKSNPDFKTEIRDHNMFNQYTRDFIADNPHLKMNDVRKFWALKKQLPTETGFIKYDPSDLRLK